jgi:DNA-directed RNA polymerase specialized sigma24 family protein
MESLTQKVLQYQKTHEGLRDLVGELAPRVYGFPRRKMGWDEDACGDFYLFIHSRLVRMLDRFRDQGKPFESYLCAVLTWQLRNFARERKRSERAWNVSLRLQTDEEAPEQPSTQWLCAPQAISRLIRSDADRRNFLFLVLKCSCTIDPVEAARLAGIAGVDVKRLVDLVASLREIRNRRQARLETFRFRRNKAFSQARLLETELRTEMDPLRTETLRARVSRARRRMRSAMTRMARVGLAPTNREIASLLGVPKGTVDSGLYWLKKKLASVYDPDNLRSA